MDPHVCMFASSHAGTSTNTGTRLHTTHVCDLPNNLGELPAACPKGCELQNENQAGQREKVEGWLQAFSKRLLPSVHLKWLKMSLCSVLRDSQSTASHVVFVPKRKN